VFPARYEINAGKMGSMLGECGYKNAVI
jgi:hypothetical protein